MLVSQIQGHGHTAAESTSGFLTASAFARSAAMVATASPDRFEPLIKNI
jgi:hypothetical protein